MTRHQAILVAITVLASMTLAVLADGQVVYKDKVLADPVTDARRYDQQLEKQNAAFLSSQSARLASVDASVNADEASFDASLAATASSMNAQIDTAGASDEASSEAVAPPASRPGMGGRIFVIILAIAGGVAALAVLFRSKLTSMLKGKKHRRRRKRRSDDAPQA